MERMRQDARSVTLSRALFVSALVAAAGLAGCGGGHNFASSGSTGGLGSSTGTVAGSSLKLSLTRFDVDVPTGKVKVTALGPDGKALAKPAAKAGGRAIFTAGAISFASSDLITTGGDAGQRELTLSLTNNTAQVLPSSVNVVVGNLAASTAPGTGTFAAATQVSSFSGTGTSGQADGAYNSATFNTPTSACAGAGPSAGAWFVADLYEIRRVDANGTVTTVAGSGSNGSTDGFGGAALFGHSATTAPIQQIACDGLGNVFVADKGVPAIRRVTPQGNVASIVTAGLTTPVGIAVSSDGTRVYVADSGAFKVFLFQLTGSDPTVPASYTKSTVAGSASGAPVDGVGATVVFSSALQQITLLTDNSGNETLFVADAGNNVIRRVDTPSASAGGVVTTIAGTGSAGTTDGRGSSATFKSLVGLTGYYLPSGSLLLFASNGDGSTVGEIRAIQLDAGANPVNKSSYSVYTIAGSTTGGTSTDGTGTSARFSNPAGLASVSGTLVLGDIGTVPKLRKVSVASALQSGSGSSSGSDTVRLVNWDSERPNSASSPAWVKSISGSGNLQFYVPSTVNGFSFTAYVEADSDVVNLPGVNASNVNVNYVSTLAGDGVAGSGGGPGKVAEFNGNAGIAAVPPSLQPLFGFSIRAVVADVTNDAIRAIDTSGNVTTFSAGSFTTPTGVAVGPDGSVYVADPGKLQVFRVTPAGSVTSIAGIPMMSGTNDSTGNMATFDANLYGICVDGAGTLYVSDGQLIRRIILSPGADPTLNTSWTVKAMVNSASAAYTGICADTDGKVYAADRVRHIVVQCTRTGATTMTAATLAGSAGTSGSTDGTGTGARFNTPYGITVDAAHNLYVADTNNNEIRRVTIATAVVVTLAGSTGSGFTDGVAAAFNGPKGIAEEAFGTLLVSDTGNDALRAVQRIVNQ